MTIESLYDCEVTTLAGEVMSFRQFQGKLLLIVNVASRCGFTPQYKGLQLLYDRYRARGFEVLGFPCNQFGRQESNDPAEIRQFCEGRFNVTFPLFNKIEVNGDQQHPLYQQLKQQAAGFLGVKAIKWNFTKFLVGKDGSVVRRFAPITKPTRIMTYIEEQLSA